MYIQRIQDSSTNLVPNNNHCHHYRYYYLFIIYIYIYIIGSLILYTTYRKHLSEPYTKVNFSNNNIITITIKNLPLDTLTHSHKRTQIVKIN